MRHDRWCEGSGGRGGAHEEAPRFSLFQVTTQSDGATWWSKPCLGFLGWKAEPAVRSMKVTARHVSIRVFFFLNSNFETVSERWVLTEDVHPSPKIHQR